MTARRCATAARIARAARELALAHGVDGFTMDQLAEKVGVSRRTLFNYFPGKYDALLGGGQELTPEAIDRFREGGPTGDLVEDMLVLADQILGGLEDQPADAALRRRTLRACPELMRHSYLLMERGITDFQEHLLAREGADLDPAAARALLATLLAVGHVALEEYAEGGDSRTTPAALLRARMNDLRRLLA